MENNFKVEKLGECAEIFTGYAFKSNEYENIGHLKVVRGDNVSTGFLRWTDNKTKYWNNSVIGLEKYFLCENDILIGMDGSRIGLNKAIVVKGDLPLILAQRVACIRAKSNYDQDYLALNILSNRFYKYVEAVKTGTSIPHISAKQIRDFEIVVPNYNVQRKIGKIYCDFNKKIELNNEMNKTLEEMAQVIFKSWFVDFEPFKDGEFEESECGVIPKGWKSGTVGEIIDVNPKTTLTKGKTYNFVDMGNVPTNSARVNIINNRDFSGGGSRFKNGDVIFARITPCLENGKTAIVDFLEDDEVAFGSTEFLVFRGIGWNAMYFGYCLSRYDKFRTYAIQHMNGSSGRQRVSKGDIENYKIVIPPKDILLLFNEQVKDYFEKIKQNDINSNNLKSIRDLLLPKLILGEL